ncbi:hypothetical protein Tco_0211738 [Tanacetum coccineum]
MTSKKAQWILLFSSVEKARNVFADMAMNLVDPVGFLHGENPTDEDTEGKCRSSHLSWLIGTSVSYSP